MRKQSLFLVASMLAAVAAASPAPDSYLLRLKLQPDQTIKYQLKSEVAAEMMGQDIGQTSSMVLTMATAKAEKGIKVTSTISDIKMEYAAGNPMGANVDEMKSAMESIKIMTTYDDRGNASDVKIETDNDSVRMMASTITGGRMGFMGSVYPEKEVKVGDTWQIDLDLSKMLNPSAEKAATDKKSIIPVVYTLDKVENGIATISSVSKGKGDAEMPQGMTMTMTLDIKSTMHIDLATGLIVDVTSDGTTDIETGMGTISQKSKSTIKRL